MSARFAPRIPRTPDAGPDALDAFDRRIIARLQDGIAPDPRPFAGAARLLALTEDELITRLRRLIERGFATRFGPLINAERAGGFYMLAALGVPEERFEEVAAIVNAFDEVAHNYARDHAWNMWFVIAASSRARAEDVARAIERRTGLRVLRLPKEREYFVDFRVPVAEEEEKEEKTAALMATSSPRGNDEMKSAPPALDEADRALLAAMQAGLPLRPDPWVALARVSGLAGEEVRKRVRGMLETGVIRRIALVPNHYALGFRANGMSVWDVADERIDELGEKVGALPFVSHCYRRPRQEGWPYNLFAMVHGRDRAEVNAQLAAITAVLGDAARGREVLYSTRILKKTGVRLFAPAPAPAGETESASCSA